MKALFSESSTYIYGNILNAGLINYIKINEVYEVGKILTGRCEIQGSTLNIMRVISSLSLTNTDCLLSVYSDNSPRSYITSIFKK